MAHLRSTAHFSSLVTRSCLLTQAVGIAEMGSSVHLWRHSVAFEFLEIHKWIKLYKVQSESLRIGVKVSIFLPVQCHVSASTSPFSSHLSGPSSSFCLCLHICHFHRLY